MIEFFKLLGRIFGLSPATPLPIVSVSIPLGSGYTKRQPPAEGHSRLLDDAEPELAKRYLQLAAEYKLTTGHDLFITCTYRTPKEQFDLYARGRTTPGAVVTMIDGLKIKSRHNYYPSQAVDVCVDLAPDNRLKIPVWDPKYYTALGPLCAKYGLEWGGNFKSFKDYPHIQLPAKW